MCERGRARSFPSGTDRTETETRRARPPWIAASSATASNATASAAAIANYEKRLAQARADLSHINAAITIFEASGDRAMMPPYADIHRIFKHGEIGLICKRALADEGPLDTRELSLRVMRAKGLDDGDNVLRKTIAFRIVQSLRLQWKRGKIVTEGKRRGVRLWRLPDQPEGR